MNKIDRRPVIEPSIHGLSGRISQDFLLSRATPGDYLPGLPAWWPDCELILNPSVWERALAVAKRLRPVRSMLATKPGQGGRRCRRGRMGV